MSLKKGIKRENEGDDRGGHEGVEGVRVPAALVPVWLVRSFPEKSVNLYAAALYEVVVHDDDAEDRAEQRPQAAEEVVDGYGAIEDVPGHHHDGEDGRYEAAALEVYVFGKGVGEVVGRPDEVGDDVDPDRGDREGQGAYGEASVLGIFPTSSTGSVMASP